VAITPPVVVSAPEPRRLRSGLLAASGIVDLPPHGRAGGIIYEPVSCGYARSYDTLCTATERVAEKTFDAADSIIEREPFIVYATVKCGPVGGSTLKAKVLRRLANGEQSVVEQAMGGILAAGAMPLVAPGATITDVVGELEQWLYGNAPAYAQYGNVGYLHASPRILSYAREADLVIQDGPILRTHMGTIWVFGGGYTDDGTIYVSGNVTVWRDPEIFVPPQAQVLDKTTNQVYMLAERGYVVSYDCVAASAVFDWGVPT